MMLLLVTMRMKSKGPGQDVDDGICYMGGSMRLILRCLWTEGKGILLANHISLLDFKDMIKALRGHLQRSEGRYHFKEIFMFNGYFKLNSTNQYSRGFKLEAA